MLFEMSKTKWPLSDAQIILTTHLQRDELMRLCYGDRDLEDGSILESFPNLWSMKWIDRKDYLKPIKVVHRVNFNDQQPPKFHIRCYVWEYSGVYKDLKNLVQVFYDTRSVYQPVHAALSAIFTGGTSVISGGFMEGLSTSTLFYSA